MTELSFILTIWLTFGAWQVHGQAPATHGRESEVSLKTQAPSPLPDEDTDIVVTGEGASSEIPAGQTFEVFEKRNESSVSEIIERSPGVFVQKSSGVGSKDSISVRGFGSQHTRVLLNGLPISTGGGYRQSLEDIPIDWVDQATVQKGPSADGSSTMGGVIRLDSPKKGKASQLRLSSGSFETRSAGLRFVRSGAKSQYLLSASYAQSSGEFSHKMDRDEQLYDISAKDERVKNNQSEQKAFRASYSGDDTPIDVDLSFTEREKGLPGRRQQPLFRVRESLQASALSAHLKSRPVGPDWRFQARLQGRKENRDLADPLGEIGGFAKVYRERSESQFLAWQAQHFWSDQVTIRVKSELRNEDFQTTDTSHQRWDGLASVDTERSFFSDRLIMNLAVTRSFARALQAENTFQVSGLFVTSARSQLQFHGGTGFRFPDIKELYQRQGLVVGNKDLRSEKSIGGDIGLQIKGPWHSKIKATVFYYSIKDLIEYAMINGFRYQPYNFRSAENFGLELSGSTPLSGRLSLDGNVSFQRTLDSDPKSEYFRQMIPHRPQTYGSLGATLKLSNSWGVNSRFQFALGRYSNRSNSLKIADRENLNLGASYNDNRKLTLEIEVQNVTNNDNVDLRGFPLANRGLYANASYKF